MGKIDLPTLVAIGGLILTLWKSYDSNRKQTEQMHKANLVTLNEINYKLDVIWDWFIKNQIKNS